MQHRVSKFALLALLCLASTRAHGARPIQPVFHLANFSHPLVIDNPYLSLAAGRHIVFYEVEGGECAVNDFIVTASTKSDFQGIYAGLSARVISDRVWLDEDCDGGRDLLLEETADWHGQDNAGNVWYFGEDSSAFEYDDAGNLISTSKEGSWEAGRNGARAGLVMLAHPVRNVSYRQEFSVGIAEDLATVKRTNALVSTGLGDFSGCVVTRESTRLSPGDVEYKSYCPVVGLVLVEHSGQKGGAEAVDLGL
jgi:hypothetical protein